MSPAKQRSPHHRITTVPTSCVPVPSVSVPFYPSPSLFSPSTNSLPLLSQHYSFCIFCQKTWHGPTNACSLPRSSRIVTAFLEGTPEERLALERRYGKANIERLVKVVEEDRVNREWLERNTIECADCRVRVEKSAGCNHMSCELFDASFCRL